MGWLAIAQATWVWEAHLARFVVDSSQIIKKFDRFKQMNRYVKATLERKTIFGKDNKQYWTMDRKAFVYGQHY